MMKKRGHMSSYLDHALLPGDRRRRGPFEKPGLGSRAERLFNGATVVLVILFATGWSYAIRDVVVHGAPSPVLSGDVTANPLSDDAAPATPFLVDLALRAVANEPNLRGMSGAVRVYIQNPGDSLPQLDSL